MRRNEERTTTGPTQLFSSWLAPRPGLMDPVADARPSGGGKPEGGLWTSTYDDPAGRSSEWVRFCREQHPSALRPFGWLLEPREGAARVFEVRNEADADALRALYPHPGPSGISFEALAEGGEIDGVRLVDPGLFRMRDRGSWDVECTFWVRFSFGRRPRRVQLS